MVRLKYLVISFLVLSLLASTYMLVIYPKKSLSNNPSSVYFQISEGVTVKSIVKQLQANGIIHSYEVPLFYGYVRAKGLQRKIQAGEYV
ncbi:MAG TPA: hypothetical protein PLD88_00650, partial [Candidatus Berkiella sp.]|nr:hypothetical protein [Candidatus Berkiella sp.]